MKTLHSARAAALAIVSCALMAGCGAASPAPMVAVAGPAPAAAPPVLDRSVFTASGTVSEDQLQHVLESPIDLQFPARIGVVPLAQAFDAQAKATITVRGTASRDLAQSLIGQPYFSHVSDISTDLPNGGGLEGLRAIAARYRLRYLLLYSERFEDTTHANAWAWLYPTVLGVFLAPGVTVSSRGLAQADLLDVRTGTVLFSVVEPMETSSQQLAVGSARAHAELQQKVAAAAAKKLARRVHEQTDALIAFADESTKKGDTAVARILPAPVIRSRPASAP